MFMVKSGHSGTGCQRVYNVRLWSKLSPEFELLEYCVLCFAPHGAMPIVLLMARVVASAMLS
jgi:hypothetical protein